MATKLLYLDEFDIETCQANLQAIKQFDDGRISLVLNQTCFYPRGGGQDWDTGTIAKDDALFEVTEVRLDDEGIVHHIGSVRTTGFSVGDSIAGNVDHARRVLNTRLHSAGHVIDMAIDALGLDWVPTKGQHYPDLSAIEYAGTWDPDKSETIRVSIENKANELIVADIENTIVFMPVDEMQTVCRHVPDNIPTNKPARVVMYGKNFGVPCGGTHVKHLSQVGNISIPKIKYKKGVIRVSYHFSDLSS